MGREELNSLREQLNELKMTGFKKDSPLVSQPNHKVHMDSSENQTKRVDKPDNNSSSIEYLRKKLSSLEGDLDSTKNRLDLLTRDSLLREKQIGNQLQLEVEDFKLYKQKIQADIEIIKKYSLNKKTETVDNHKAAIITENDGDLGYLMLEYQKIRDKIAAIESDNLLTQTRNNERIKQIAENVANLNSSYESILLSKRSQSHLQPFSGSKVDEKTIEYFSEFIKSQKQINRSNNEVMTKQYDDLIQKLKRLEASELVRNARNGQETLSSDALRKISRHSSDIASIQNNLASILKNMNAFKSRLDSKEQNKFIDDTRKSNILDSTSDLDVAFKTTVKNEIVTLKIVIEDLKERVKMVNQSLLEGSLRKPQELSTSSIEFEKIKNEIDKGLKSAKDEIFSFIEIEKARSNNMNLQSQALPTMTPSEIRRIIQIETDQIYDYLREFANETATWAIYTLNSSYKNATEKYEAMSWIMRNVEFISPL